MAGSNTSAAGSASPSDSKLPSHVPPRGGTSSCEVEAYLKRASPPVSPKSSRPHSPALSKTLSSSSITTVTASRSPNSAPQARSYVCASSSRSTDSQQKKSTGARTSACTKRRPRSYTQPDIPTAFLFTPLRSGSATLSLLSAPSSPSKTASHHYSHSHALAHSRDRDRDRGGDRPTRSSSSPQLIRPRTRARSSSASSSASMTATEEDFSYAYERTSASTSTSSARFPAMPYPSTWTFPGPSQTRASASGANSSSTLNLRNRRYTTDEIVVSSQSEDSGLDSEGVEQDEMIFVSPTNGHSGSSSRIRRRKEDELLRMVTTARGQPCAGETETELDEIPSRLPTSRKIPNSEPLIVLPINTIINYLFQACRLLSIVPAVFGTIFNIHHAIYRPKPAHFQNTSIDYIVCALWAILTGLQCLRLTTGLLHRWKAYYATLSTLIRLVALQAICWPATHLTLTFFNYSARPVACWALIGTTTCISRSVQIWVTSNLYLPPSPSTVVGDMVRRDEGKLGPRRWDWRQVSVKCVLPAGILYFLTAWAMILKGELRDC